MTNSVSDQVTAALEPWAGDLGADRDAYTHHVVRVLLLCDALYVAADADGPAPSARPELLVAAVCHDLGVWTAGTFDYLPPSVELARARLAADGRAADTAFVTEVIEQHHKLRPAGSSSDPVEIFRRADAIDLTLGLRSFGLPRAVYRDLLRAFPSRGFHRRIARLAATRALTHPLSPAPMLKW
ncbi:hypothetical protein [Nocardia stercoris]|uniref:HD domain-containing protein n=1 Tax=Nocardia stercoris TaxID=2483361 RepID=A0A3M2LDH7_9NOCA|nr:hypothetical protein [Nocardia stercoris]RMI32748.1 hypothetical protein EBN03_12410 [Nocardia stercoris]